MAMETTISSTASARPGLPSVIVAATIGNVLEWFDFLVYGFFAVTIAEVARAASGHAAAALPISVMNSRRFIIRSPRQHAAGTLPGSSDQAPWRWSS